MSEKSELTSIIRQHIRLHGPLTVDVFWNYCLSHPVHGYYIKQDPLGAAGDFTTAPEISQLFGEMIGIWVAEQWLRLGQPTKIHLVECGPGRGTLMGDILRTLRAVPKCLPSIAIHLIENSPVLRQRQAEKLAKYQVAWHDNLQTIPDDAPCLIIGNEFLDVLPIRQFIRQAGVWCERVVGFDKEENFIWGVTSSSLPTKNFPEGDIFETSPAREAVFSEMCDCVAMRGGAILMIDYGHEGPACGDTLQAVKNHKYVDVLTHVGDADLTSHIDFGVLKYVAIEKNLAVQLSGQGDFLRSKGIEIRAAQLMAQKDVSGDLKRLIDDNDMGKLFRVMEVINEKTST